MFLLFLTYAKSNDITNIFVKSIIEQKIAYNVNMSPEHFEIKEQRVASLITVKNRQLSTLPFNFDFSHIWQ